MLRPGSRLLPLVLSSLSILSVAVAAAGPAAAAPPDPRPSPEQSTLTWGPCPAEEELDPAFQCATLPVPLDYNNPAAGTVDLALIRLPADPAVRQGAVLFNPGGPGGSGYDYVAGIGLDVAREMAGMNRFDLIGFDPRGVDRSGAIECVSDAVLDATLFPDDTPDNSGEAFALQAAELAMPLSCRARYGDTLALYSTENIARDMDRIREALGDEQLSYIGVSYGTYLGAIYATMFPERVRAMVLDSAVDRTGDTLSEQWTTQLMGFEGAFDNWAAWCEASAECAFTGADVAGRWDALMAQLDAQPIRAEDGRVVNQATMELATKSTLYSESMWPLLGTALADAAAGDGSGLMQLADIYNGRHDDGTYDSIMQSFPVISCASGLWADAPPDPAAMLAEIQAAAPRFSRSYSLEDMRDVCLDYIPHDVQPITPSYSGAAPVVVVGGLNDPATPFRYAEELTAAMGPSARLVTYTGEGHGQILNSSCVTDIEATAIAALQLPAPGAICEPDPPFPQPAFWAQLPVPAGVGPAVEHPMIELAFGLDEADYYSDAWALSGDPATVAAAYTAALPALGLQVAASDTVEGVTRVVAFAPDGTTLIVLMIPPALMAPGEDLEVLADAVPPGQGLVIAFAFTDV
jgi:pimeloyl-ACP methyl ester carboxylesterase